MNSLKVLSKQLVEALSLPPAYQKTVRGWWYPLAQSIATRHAPKKCGTDAKSPYFLGVQGLQGSGKTTASASLKAILETCFELQVAVLSIDDFYLTREQRTTLAREVHPLFMTRGVPGTHDISLLESTLQALSSAHEDSPAYVPRFSKANDDRSERSDWSVFTSRPDVIILEGWCVGLDAEPEEALDHAINQLESEEDTDGHWRRYANNCLASDYRALFAQLDDLLVLKAPGFDVVKRWRGLQEQKLARLSPHGTEVMDSKALSRFIAHYERLSVHALNSLDSAATWVLELNDSHEISAVSLNTSRVDFIVSTDVDGTLIDHETYSFTPALIALRRVIFSCGLVLLNTSKTSAETQALQIALKLKGPSIVETGSALVEASSTTEFGRSLAEVLALVDAFRHREGVDLQGFSTANHEWMNEYTGLNGDAAIKARERRYSEPLLWRGSESKKDELIDFAVAKGFNVIQGGRFLHVLGATDKSVPLRLIKVRYPTATVVALGDSPNDLDMLNVADLAVCVSNPKVSESLAPIAPKVYHTEASGPRGWTEAMNKFLDGRL